MSEKLSRDFKGIWIPKEIWLNPTLSWAAKGLWAEIDSLYCEEKGGCYASEEYLSEFLGVQRRRFYLIIQELTEAGLLEKVSFDGRTTIRKAISPSNGAQQQCTKVHSSSAQKCTPDMHKNAQLSYIENKVEKKVEREPPPLLFFGQYVRMPKTHHDALIKDHGEKKIAEYIDRVNIYCESSGKSYKGYAATIRTWIAKDTDKQLNAPNTKKTANDQIAKSLNNDLEARLAAGRIEVSSFQYELIQKKSLKDSNPDYAKGYRYKDIQGRWVST